jgi:hypothetical protein
MRNELKYARVTDIYVIITNKGVPTPTKGVIFSQFSIWDRVHSPTFATWIAKRNFCFAGGEMCNREPIWDFLQSNTSIQ